jgi:hypothetical protein
VVVGSVSRAYGADGENDEVCRIEVSTMGAVALLTVSRGSAIARLEGSGVYGEAGKNLMS